MLGLASMPLDAAHACLALEQNELRRQDPVWCQIDGLCADKAIESIAPPCGIISTPHFSMTRTSIIDIHDCFNSHSCLSIVGSMKSGKSKANI